MPSNAIPAVVLLPFNSHLPCSRPICLYLKALLDRSTQNPIHVIGTGAAALGFAPDAKFFSETLLSINSQLVRSQQSRADSIIGVFPKVDSSRLLVYLFCFSSGDATVNQVVNFLEADSGQNDETIVGGLFLSYQQLCKGVRLTHKGEVDDFYRFATAPSPEVEDTVLQIGITLAVSGALSAARACWMEVLGNINKESPFAAINIGQSYSDEQNYEEAVDWFTTALDLSSDTNARASCLYNRGVALSSQKKYDNAIQDFLETIRLRPAFGMAYNNIGACYLDRGDKKQAAQWFKRCLSLDEDISPIIGVGDAKQLASQNLGKLSAS